MELPQEKLYRMSLINIKDKIDYSIDTLHAYLVNNTDYVILSKKKSWLSVQDGDYVDINEETVVDAVAQFIYDRILYEETFVKEISEDELLDIIKENLDVFYELDTDDFDGITGMTIELV